MLDSLILCPHLKTWITHLLLVYLEVGDPHQEVLLLARLGDVAEDVGERVRDDALVKLEIYIKTYDRQELLKFECNNQLEMYDKNINQIKRAS